MIEINVRIKIDTNDPREAYLQAMSMLSFSGHMFDVSDYWLANGKPIPKSVAQSIQEPLHFIRDCGRAVEHDPGLRPLLEDLQELTQCVTPERDKVDAMVAFNELILDGLPDGMEVVAAANKAEMFTDDAGNDYPVPVRINVLPNAGGARDIGEEIANLFECIRNSSEPFRKLDFNVGEADDLTEPDEILGSRAIDVDIPMDATDIEIAELLAQTIPGNRISKYFQIMSELPVFEERPLRTKIGTYFDVTTWMWVANAVIPYRVSND